MRSSRLAHAGRFALGGALAVTILSTTAPPSAAAPTDVVINEIMYHALSDLDGDDFLELANTGPDPVDVSGWTFSGITLTLPAGTTIPPGGFLVVAKDVARFQSTYGFAPAAGYGGNLSNSGETITLRDAGGTTIDSVTYLDVDPWPTSADGVGPSLELIDSDLDNDDWLNWAAAVAGAGHTAGTANSVRRSGLGPRIGTITASPAVPTVGQPTTVTATITDSTSATLRYRVDFLPEATVPMTPSGGDTVSATIPAAPAGSLIRYRVESANGNAASRSPRSDDTINYHGLVVPHGLTSSIPVLEWFLSDADYNLMVNNPEVDIVRYGALAYGTEVIDNVEMNIKGHASQRDPKVSWKFHFPQGHDFTMGGLLTEPVDEFDLQADWSDKAHGRGILSWDAYERAGVASHQMFPVRAQRNGSFQGLYNYSEVFDGTWRERNGYDDQQFFEAETSAFSTRPINVQFSKKTPDDEDFAPIAAVVAGVRLSGVAQRNYLLANVDLPQLINYAAVTAIIEHHDSSSKNFYLTQDPDTARWSILPWDLDHTWGNGCCNVESPFVTPAEPGDKTSALMRALLAQPEWRAMYFRRLRTLVDDVLAPGRPEALYDARLSAAQPTAALDFAEWPYPTNTNYTVFRRRLFNDIAERRAAFSTDPRVPSSQPANPTIVVNEIQHSPAGGDGAEFVELFNPTGQAVDVSGWAISGGIDLQIQPGTVIPALSAMTFVGDDPAFRAAYSPTVFVGDRFDGSLPAVASLTLTRADGSVADTVDYGGAGWPEPTAGQSLELTDPGADNNDGSAWRLSAGPGTPGLPTEGAPVVTLPAAPGIGTAVAGDGSATVTWTAPGGGPVSGYQVRVVDSGGNQVGSLRPAAAGATSLLVTGLANGVAYRFQVAATNSAGTGAYSELSNAVTPAAVITVPGPPVIGTPSRGAIGGALTAIARWAPPASTGGSEITGYRVTALRMSSADSDATVLSSTTSRVLGPRVRQREFTLAAGDYRFEVVAINAVGTGPASARSANVVPR